MEGTGGLPTEKGLALEAVYVGAEGQGPLANVFYQSSGNPKNHQKLEKLHFDISTTA